MIRPQDCEILQWRSFDDEAAFFASMGRFFASARVRRECGGYPLSDGPYHRWFVLRRQGGHADTGVRQPGATSRRGSPARCLPACGSARSRAVPHPARAGPRTCRPTRAGLYHPRAPGLRAPSRTARLRRAFHPG
ncbi:hypothetical protein P4200_23715 [Pseudomonas aeruginosa]|nr:hypothetical protein [Pseudomonas aeruginosa]